MGGVLNSQIPTVGDNVQIYLTTGVFREGRILLIDSDNGNFLLDEGYAYPTAHETAQVISIRKLGPDGD